MAERELANHVLEVADRTAYQDAAQRVISIHLSIGGRRLVDLARLTRAFDTVARGTVAEGAVLQVNVLPVRHCCQNGGRDFDQPPTTSSARTVATFITSSLVEKRFGLLRSGWTMMRLEYPYS